MDKDYITFSFGANWQSFLKTVTSERIESAQRDIVAWLGKDAVRGKTVLDIGCGSGIHSLVFYMLGAQEIVSFDYDQKSVEATQSLWKKVNRPSHWKILQGSVLDKDFIQNLGQGFDIVYAWGVLHHTGAMWEAIENSCVPVKKNGRYWIALYAKGPRYQQDLALKRRYNN
ncbi:MAG: class I SAM-dependent methyltransferase, partial [Desulfobacteraceae bacterium]|nr:class I SAM-dependent methyltransferase [Desulfobacteraceae bacterium]